MGLEKDNDYRIYPGELMYVVLEVIRVDFYNRFKQHVKGVSLYCLDPSVINTDASMMNSVEKSLGYQVMRFFSSVHEVKDFVCVPGLYALDFQPDVEAGAMILTRMQFLEKVELIIGEVN